MFAPFLQKTFTGIRQTIPVISTLIFILGSVLVWPIPYVGTLSPSLGLAAIYYWAMHRPDLLRPLVVFLLGLLVDALNYYPLGLTAFIYVGIYQLSYSQRRFFVGQLFLMLWSGFCLVAVIAAVGQWLFLSLTGDRVLSFAPVFFQTLITMVLFPVPAWIFNKLQKAFLTVS